MRPLLPSWLNQLLVKPPCATPVAFEAVGFLNHVAHCSRYGQNSLNCIPSMTCLCKLRQIRRKDLWTYPTFPFITWHWLKMQASRQGVNRFWSKDPVRYTRWRPSFSVIVFLVALSPLLSDTCSPRTRTSNLRRQRSFCFTHQRFAFTWTWGKYPPHWLLSLS